MSPPVRHWPQANGLRQATDRPRGRSATGLGPKCECRSAQRAAALCLLLALTGANATSDEAQRLKQERAVIEAEFKRGELECAKRFEVTRCVDDLQRQRRAALAVVRQQEIAIEEARRVAAAQANQQRLKDKQAKAAAKAADKPASSPADSEQSPAAQSVQKQPKTARAHQGRPAAAGPASAASGSAAASAASPTGAAPASAPSPQSRQPSDRRASAAQGRADAASAAAKRAADQEKRLIDRAERRLRVEQRNAERAAKGKQSVPLPDPAAASSPAR